MALIAIWYWQASGITLPCVVNTGLSWLEIAFSRAQKIKFFVLPHLICCLKTPVNAKKAFYRSYELVFLGCIYNENSRLYWHSDYYHSKLWLCIRQCPHTYFHYRSIFLQNLIRYWKKKSKNELKNQSRVFRAITAETSNSVLTNIIGRAGVFNLTFVLILARQFVFVFQRFRAWSRNTWFELICSETILYLYSLIYNHICMIHQYSNNPNSLNRKDSIHMIDPWYIH